MSLGSMGRWVTFCFRPGGRSRESLAVQTMVAHAKLTDVQKHSVIHGKLICGFGAVALEASSR